MSKPPSSAVKERFESKEKLVAAVQKLATPELWLDRTNDAKGLVRVSNAKLLRLHDILTRAGKEFGSRSKLIESILGLLNRAKDAGYKAKLELFPLPRLLDLHGAASRRKQHAEAAAKPRAEKSARKAPPKTAAKAKAAPKKAAAKKAPAKKAPAKGAKKAPSRGSKKR
jgi:hypothetical protein